MTAAARVNTLRTARDQSDTPSKPGVSYAQLCLLGLAFTGGTAVAILWRNALGPDQISFSTPSLIAFLFGIALSAASIVLAIAAIALGKASEQAMIQRSDESIQLQNQVFVKTTEALGRIESSTGVTEKRIEDMISGRAGDISRAVAEQVYGRPASRGKDPHDLEEAIRKSLLEEFSSSRAASSKEERAATKRRHEEEERAYRKFQGDTLAMVANLDSVTCEKIGDGQFGSSGDDLVDGIFRAGNERIAISALSTGDHLSHFDGLTRFLQTAAGEIAAGRYDRLLVVFNAELKEGDPSRKVIDSVIPVLRPEIARKIHFFDGEGEKGREKLVQFIRSLPTKLEALPPVKPGIADPSASSRDH